MITAAARENMVDSQVRTSDVTDAALQAAMRRIPRERFCAAGSAELAYAETPVEIAPGRQLLEPRELAKLLQELAPRAGERALVICEPYAAAVLADAGLEVTAVDTPEVVARVRDALHDEGVETVVASQPATPDVESEFDLILGGGAVADVPASWVDRLAEGGRLGVVVRTGVLGRATLFVRGGGATTGRAVFEAAPPYLPGLEPKPAFAF